eukprot:7631651-Pyramimonas_sp.AAC.1
MPNAPSSSGNLLNMFFLAPALTGLLNVCSASCKPFFRAPHERARRPLQRPQNASVWGLPVEARSQICFLSLEL